MDIIDPWLSFFFSFLSTQDHTPEGRNPGLKEFFSVHMLIFSRVSFTLCSSFLFLLRRFGFGILTTVRQEHILAQTGDGMGARRYRSSQIPQQGMAEGFGCVVFVSQLNIV